MNEAIFETVIDETVTGEANEDVFVGVLHEFVETITQVVSDIIIVPMEETIMAEEVVMADTQVSFIEVSVPEVSIVVQS